MNTTKIEEENRLLKHLINSICNLYTLGINESEKHFFEKRDLYFSYEKELQEKFNYHPTLSLIFLKKENFDKLQIQYKLNFEIQRNEFTGEPGYGNLVTWNKRGKKNLVSLALKSQGINFERLFPPSLFSRLCRKINSLL